MVLLSSNDKGSQQNQGDGFLYFPELNADATISTSERARRISSFLTGTSSNQVELAALVNHRPPIGLKLRKTSYLLQLTEQKLNSAHAHEITPAQKDEKWKAEHCYLSLLKIGSFKVEAKYDGDLVGKCYFAKRRLIWEILYMGLKYKIEVQWQNILAMRASLERSRPGILEIELDRPPIFCNETNPKPQRHTEWNLCQDFTAGQASMLRRHRIEFHPGHLDSFYMKLIQYDERMFRLSQGRFPSLRSPFFDSPLCQGQEARATTPPLSLGHVLGSRTTTSATEQQQQQPPPVVAVPVVPSQQIQQQFRLTTPLPPPVPINRATLPTSADIWSSPPPPNEAISNHRLQHPNVAIIIDKMLQDPRFMQTFSETDFEPLPDAIHPQLNGPVSNFGQKSQQPADHYGQETLCNLANVNSPRPYIPSPSVEADVACNTGISMPIDGPSSSVNTLNALANRSEEQYPAGNNDNVLMHFVSDYDRGLLYPQPFRDYPRSFQ